jgi:hypothetical protein
VPAMITPSASNPVARNTTTGLRNANNAAS